MVINAFRQLSEVLERLESSGTDVQHVTVDQDLSESASELTAELAVEVPIAEEGTRESVSFASEAIDIENGRMSVDVTVTVSDDGSRNDVDGLSETATPPDTADARAVPAYKDPQRLREVYERHDTFPEMTAALNVDVTSETVRRHMVKHDIHDPDDARPLSYTDATVTAGDDHVADEPAVVAESEVDEQPAREQPADSSADSADRSGQDDQSPQSAVTDGGSTSEMSGSVHGKPSSGPTPSSDDESVDGGYPSAATTPVNDAVADDTGSRLPDDVTVGELTEAVVRSRTVHEVADTIGISQVAARHFLQEQDLINFVSHPLAGNKLTASVEAVSERLGSE